MRSRRRVLQSAALGLAALLAVGADPDPEDPPLCRDALAAQPEEEALAALALAEQRSAREARTAATAARKLARQTLGVGESAQAVLPEYEALMEQHAEAKRRGKVICLCRERRGDPHRQDCELLYPVVIR